MSERIESPNPDIDKAITALMKECKDQPIDIRVKVIAQAIAWEKAKKTMKEDGEEFNPDNL